MRPFFSSTRCLFALAAFLCGASAHAVAFEPQFTLAGRKELGAVLCRWTAAGLAVQLAHDGVTNVIRITPGATRSDGPADGVFLQSPPPITTNRVWLVFKRQPRAWTLYVADAPVARFRELGTNSVSLAVEASVLPGEEERDSYTQRLGSFRFDDAFMVPEGEKLSGMWDPIQGSWSLHAVTNRLASQIGKLRGGRMPTPVRSPNFYSLLGTGTSAVILAGETFRDSYSVRAAVQHNSGVNGIVFLATEAGDCHGLTARTDPVSEHLVIELWRGSISRGLTRRVLHAFQTDLTPGQWLQLEAVIFDDRLQIVVDGIELVNRPCPDLPPGGRYGLIACTEEGTRFDDFSAASHEEYPFDGAEAFAAVTRQIVGDVAWRGTDTEVRLPRAASLAFRGQGDRMWRFGSDTDAPHRLSARFLCERSEAPVILGLMVGNGTPAAPAWHFTCLLTATNRVFTLLRQEGTRAVVVDRMTRPLNPGRDIRLTLDALQPGELRAFADDRQVLFHRTDLPLGGLGAITVSGGRGVSTTLPEYTTRSTAFADRFEKNMQYVKDPFMRHWASPEGQWHTSREQATWLRGDMIRRIRLRMPVTAEPSAIHLATDEAGSNAVCRLEIREGQILGIIPALGDEPQFRVAVTNVPIHEADVNGSNRLYTVGLEDHVFWLGDDSRLLATAHLPQPAAGRRVRVEGFDEAALHQSLVRRENVFDTLFNESLQNWTINGGVWEVVNRFQCEPTWSHMNGENGDSLAALWAKYDFSGDFCAEIYAGMRHTWYDRCGDINMTVLSKRGATSDGYTVTLTGWDPDHSQNNTRLFRNGVMVTNSTSYLVPRIREGNFRLGGYEPLLRSDRGNQRDVHGAWYGVRLRRVADRLQVIFDNLPALEFTDPDPLASGSFGIWTFRNSMMVARVRIAAETIRPRPFACREIDPRSAASDVVTHGADDASLPLLRTAVCGLSPDALTDACWIADDPVSRPVVRFRRGEEGSEMCVTAHHGGGTFLVSNTLPPVAASRLLGWRFDLARSADAAFNLEFSSGTGALNGFVTTQAWSFVITGSDETRGSRRIAGRAGAVPPSPSADAPVWTPVYAWLPSEVLSSGLSVRLDGFGNLQPSDVQQGLLGNAPGTWYAVRNFRPVFRGRPDVSGNVANEAMDQVNAAIADLPPGQLHILALPPEAFPEGVRIEWAVPSDASFDLIAERDPDNPDTATLASSTPWNSPLLPPRAVWIDDQTATFTFGNAVTRIFLPRKLKNRKPVVRVELADGRTFRQALASPPEPGTPPVLLALELPEGRLTTFDDRPFDVGPFAGSAVVSLMRGGAGYGTVLKIANRGQQTRLDACLAPAYDPFLTPLIQFAYRAEAMSRVSLVAGRLQMRLTENGGLPATLGGLAATQDTWQTWLGSPLAVSNEAPLTTGLDFRPGDLRVGSRQVRDQTGLYTSLLIDDLALGPAVGPGRVLAFRAVYDDADGDFAAVQYAFAQGPQPWALRDASGQEAVRWLDASNAAVTTPATDALPEGIHHLVVRGRDAAGHVSPVADLPFLLDRTPPVITHAVAATDRYNKTCLNVTIEGGSAMPFLRNMKLASNGSELALAQDNGRVSFSASRVQLEIDWPWLLRRQLQTTRPGDTLTISINGVSDVAGNTLPRYEIPITLDTGNDKTPPTVLPLVPPENIEAWQPSNVNLAQFFNQVGEGQTQTVEDGSVVFEFKTLDIGATQLRRAYGYNPGLETGKRGWFGFSIRTLAGDTNPPPVVEIRLVPRAVPEKAAKPKTHGAYILQLPAPGAPHPFVFGTRTWQAGEWQNVMINIHDILRAEAGIDAVPDLREIVLAFPEKRARAFQIRSAAVLAPYGDTHIVRFAAYDMSGIEGLSWTGGRAAQLAIRPSRVSRPIDAVWLDVRVSDRAGNRSPVYMIPVPPVPLSDKLPAEEKEGNRP
ncbi:MAG: hypothetical protein FJ222_02360 [Lentisphaerae bacterium]|nr:hypothetical protein [Lentisphaerota bacterium]